jgi:hypothetical protein
MKKILLGTYLGLAVLSAGNLSAQAEPVDFTKVNSVLEEIIHNSVQYDQLIKSVDLKLDPKSNLTEGKVKATFKASAGSSHWAPNQDTQLSIQVGSQFKDLKSEKKEGALKIGAQLKTQVLNLIHYLGKEAIDNGRNEAKKEILEKISQAEDLNQLLVHLKNFKIVLMEQSSDDEEREFLSNLAFAVKTVDDKVVSIKIELKKPMNINFFTTITIKVAFVNIEEAKVSGGLSLASQINKYDFNQYVKSIEEFLMKIQKRNSEFLSSLELSLKSYVQSIREFLENK